MEDSDPTFRLAIAPFAVINISDTRYVSWGDSCTDFEPTSSDLTFPGKICYALGLKRASQEFWQKRFDGYAKSTFNEEFCLGDNILQLLKEMTENDTTRIIVFAKHRLYSRRVVEIMGGEARRIFRGTNVDSANHFILTDGEHVMFAGYLNSL
jgi:hypothetical protein